MNRLVLALLLLAAGAPGVSAQHHHERQPQAEGHGEHDGQPQPEGRGDHGAHSDPDHQAHHEAQSDPEGHGHHEGHHEGHDQQQHPAGHAAHGHHDGALPREPIPPLTDADRAAAFPVVDGHSAHDRRIVHMLRFDRLEAVHADGEGTGLGWEASAWIGNDWHRLLLRSEGERMGGDTEAADLEILYLRPVSRWWEGVVGLRHDFAPGGSQTWLAAGVTGLAPQWIELQATAYLGESGQLAARFEAEYEWLLSNRLVLQPLLELEAHSQSDPSRGVGSGLSSAEVGLRLRYELDRRFAPYVGVVRELRFGTTADLHRAHGEASAHTVYVAGIRFWF